MNDSFYIRLRNGVKEENGALLVNDKKAIKLLNQMKAENKLIDDDATEVKIELIEEVDKLKDEAMLGDEGVEVFESKLKKLEKIIEKF